MTDTTNANVNGDAEDNASNFVDGIVAVNCSSENASGDDAGCIAESTVDAPAEFPLKG